MRSTKGRVNRFGRKFQIPSRESFQRFSILRCRPVRCNVVQTQPNTLHCSGFYSVNSSVTTTFAHFKFSIARAPNCVPREEVVLVAFKILPMKIIKQEKNQILLSCMELRHLDWLMNYYPAVLIGGRGGERDDVASKNSQNFLKKAQFVGKF